MSEPEVLLESWSPCCNIQAFVEESDTCCYFYLWFHPGMESAFVKSCWICNTVPAPVQLDVDGMKEGRAPAMPQEYIKHDRQGMRLHPENLSIVWFEEGDAAALLEDGKILCAIPGWGGYQGFHGYSRYAKGNTPYAWELEPGEAILAARVEKSRRFWSDVEEGYWGEVQALHLQALEAFFGEHEKYFAIDGGKFPAKALVTGRKDGICYGITAGVSLLSMPIAEQYYEVNSEDFKRIELGFAAVEEMEEVCMKMYSFLSAISNLPWKEVTFLGHGHTVPCSAIEGFVAVWLLNAALMPEILSPVYPAYRGERINLLWAVPLTQEEYDFVSSREAGAADVLERVKGPLDRLHIFDGKAKLS